MNDRDARSAETTVPPLPLPPQQFQRFVAFFHVVFLGGLLLTLVLSWKQAAADGGNAMLLLCACVATQGGLYLRFFLKHPARLGWWWIHFGVGLGAWLVEWRLNPAFEWVGFAYVGQLFGVLPPRYSLPSAVAVSASYLFCKFGWDRLARIEGWGWFAMLAAMVSWIAVGLFLRHLAVTSTVRAQLIQELEVAKRKLEDAREREAEVATLRERERLARDFHDSLGHALVTLTVQLEAAQRLLASDPDQCRKALDQMKELTRSTMDDLRRSLVNLRSPGLGDRPLNRALEELATETAQRLHLKSDCALSLGSDSLRPAVGEALWRVAQEGLANVEKHASAASFSLSLTASSGEVVLRVSDDGVGLSPGALGKPGHFGLRGLRERVEGLGGSLSVLSPGRGTLIEARIPIVG